MLARFTAVMDFTSKWKLPSTPSAMICSTFGALRYFESGQTEASSAHLTVGSPVVSDHLYVKSVKGIVIVWNSSETGIATLALYCPFTKKGAPESGLRGASPMVNLHPL